MIGMTEMESCRVLDCDRSGGGTLPRMGERNKRRSFGQKLMERTTMETKYEPAAGTSRRPNRSTRAASRSWVHRAEEEEEERQTGHDGPTGMPTRERTPVSLSPTMPVQCQLGDRSVSSRRRCQIVKSGGHKKDKNQETTPWRANCRGIR